MRFCSFCQFYYQDINNRVAKLGDEWCLRLRSKGPPLIQVNKNSFYFIKYHALIIEHLQTVYPFIITLMKPNPTLYKYDEESGNKESQRIKLIEYLQKRDKKGTQLKFEAATVEVGVQTELGLIDDQIQLVYVDKKTYLYTENIDQIEQVQVYQSLRQMKRRKNRKISKSQKKRKPEKTKENNNSDSPYIIILKQNEQQKQRERRAAKIQNKQTIILNQAQLNQKKLSKQQQKVKKSHQMDTEVNLTKCICKGQLKHQEYYQCELCSNHYHYTCHRRQKTNVPYQICPFCILREIESTQEIEEILCQLYLDFDKGTTLFKGQFNFKPFEYYCSQKIRNHQLELRCIQIEGNQDKMTEIMWPNECIFFLNDCKVFEVMEISKESVVRKRKDFPLRITQFIYHQEKNIDLQKVEVKLISEGSKVFQIDENFEIKQPLYLFGVYFTKNTSFQTVVNKMINRMKTNNHKYMRNLIKNHNHEGLEVSKLTYTLLDPFSWNVIKLPVRGIHCNHAQCFDMGTYISLQLGNRTRYWKCPLCKKSTLILSQDEQQDAILERIKNNKRVPKEIVYYNSGMIEVNLYQQEESEDEYLDRKKVKKGRLKCKKSNEEQIN